MLFRSLLRKNSATGNPEPIPGQRLALEQMKITYGAALVVPESMSAIFPGQKTVPMTVVGVRLFHRGSGTGWVMRKDGEIDTDPLFNPPLLVPAGQKVFCLYRMPVREMGDVTCSVGAPTVVVPPPVVTPPPTSTTATAPSGSLVTPQGTWTFGAATGEGGNALLLNGQHVGGGYGVEYRFAAGVLIVRNILNDWYRWTGTGWTSSPAP